MSQPIPQSSIPLKPAQIYQNLRRAILELEPAEAGLTPTPAAPLVWGVLMETDYSPNVATLVCLADGTTSLYFSSGGGILGSGRHGAVAQATQAVIREAEQHFEKMTPASAFPLPAAGCVQFTILGYSGKWIVSALEAQLANGRHPFSSLFNRAQQVITQIRLLN